MTPETSPKLPFTADEWDHLRFRFMDSLMVHTELGKLAQSVDLSWPVRSKDETPSKYINLSLSELIEIPEIYGKWSRLPLLYSILSETMAFDDPFGEMVNYLDDAAQREDPALKSLQRLEVPMDFPVALCNFSESTLSLCESEQITELQQLVGFSHKMARNVIIGGDFRHFLNALIHIDVTTLSAYLPLRSGKTGLFLAESLCHLATQLSSAEAVTLLAAYNLPYQRPTWTCMKPLTKQDLQRLTAELQPLFDARCTALPDQAQQLRHAAQCGEMDLMRFFASIKDTDMASLAQAISLAALQVAPRGNGLLGRLFNR
jgi:hypothetical protein